MPKTIRTTCHPGPLGDLRNCSTVTGLLTSVRRTVDASCPSAAPRDMALHRRTRPSDGIRTQIRRRRWHRSLEGLLPELPRQLPSGRPRRHAFLQNSCPRIGSTTGPARGQRRIAAQVRLRVRMHPGVCPPQDGPAGRSREKSCLRQPSLGSSHDDRPPNLSGELAGKVRLSRIPQHGIPLRHAAHPAEAPASPLAARSPSTTTHWGCGALRSFSRIPSLPCGRNFDFLNPAASGSR
jgi:hypothetical protein